MNRRQVLKTVLLSPLLGLKTNGDETIPLTSGTSSEGAWYVWYDENGCRRRNDDKMIMLRVT